MAETERLNSTGEIFIINGTSLEIDIYVNYEREPTISDPESFDGGLVFVVDGTTDRPFATYTFQVRLKGDPNGPILGEASAPILLGTTLTGVFHPRPDTGFRFSIYENDLSVGTDARLTIRNTSDKPLLHWSITPVGDDQPPKPQDPREGAVGWGEWQIARSVQVNSYRFELFSGNTMVGRIASLELGLEQNIILNIVGRPKFNVDPEILEELMLEQELEYDVGPAVPDSISEPAPPRYLGDSNAPISFDCPPLAFYETNGGEVEVRATDPDGFVSQLEVEAVSPHVDGFTVPDETFRPSLQRGDQAYGKLRADPGLPSGQYTVTIVANRETLSQTARCELQVTVRPITVERLMELLERACADGVIDGSLIRKVSSDLMNACEALAADKLEQACLHLETAGKRVNDAEGTQISKSASEAFQRELKALTDYLGCG